MTFLVAAQPSLVKRAITLNIAKQEIVFDGIVRWFQCVPQLMKKTSNPLSRLHSGTVLPGARSSHHFNARMAVAVGDSQRHILASAEAGRARLPRNLECLRAQESQTFRNAFV